ncbi:MAG TPA: ABC transporter substrate-binding protein [Azospirillum sp.]|nr:ABC transporter substrate-binding protein [Azospirillum sp.]
MRRAFIIERGSGRGAAIIGALLVLASWAALASPATVTIACSGIGIGRQLCEDGAQAWAQRTGNRVRLISPPKSASEQLALYQQLLAAEAEDIDVFQIDVVWPGILGDYFADLTPYVDQAILDRHLPELVTNATVKGRLVGIPWFADVGLLYGRADLLEKYGRPMPRSWAELAETARLIQDSERAGGNPRLWGYVWQGRAYEGLTVNALEWIDSFRGGIIVSPDGTITVNNPRAEQALEMAASWIGSITPPGILNYTEEEARGVFQSGNAVFMRNWPYAWPLANAADSPVRDRVVVAPLPRGGSEGKHTGAIGGAMLSVSKGSRHLAAAIDLTRHLASPEEQRRRAIAGGANPTIPDLYDDPAVIASNPFFAELRNTIGDAVARPARATGMRYNQVSNAVYTSVHDVLSGQTRPAAALAELERTLVRISRGGRW